MNFEQVMKDLHNALAVTSTIQLRYAGMQKRRAQELELSNQRMARVQRNLARVKMNLAEITEKLNRLTG